MKNEISTQFGNLQLSDTINDYYAGDGLCAGISNDFNVDLPWLYAQGVDFRCDDTCEIIDRERSRSWGLSSQTVSRYALACGVKHASEPKRCIAGSNAYRILSGNLSAKTLYLSSIDGLDINMNCSMRFQNNYDNFGSILSVLTDKCAISCSYLPPYSKFQTNEKPYFDDLSNTFALPTDMLTGDNSTMWILNHPELGELSTSKIGQRAYGEACHAFGHCSLADGKQTTSEGKFSHAEGDTTYAIGYASHTEGSHTSAYSRRSHSEGWYTYIDVNADNAHAEGYYTSAFGHTSHVEGYQSKTYGSYSHAEGWQTSAIGSASHTEGRSSKTYGAYSHAEGYNSIAGAKGFYCINSTSETLTNSVKLSVEPIGWSSGDKVTIVLGDTGYPTSKLSVYDSCATIDSIAQNGSNYVITFTSNLPFSRKPGNFAEIFVNNKPNIGNIDAACFAHADGFNANAIHNYSYVWNGSNTDSINKTYASHGAGSFSINPANGISGFYIGEHSFADYLSDAVAQGQNPLSGQTIPLNGMSISAMLSVLFSALGANVTT